MKDYQEYYIQGSDHYLIPKEEFEELFEDINTWKKEYDFLKKVSSDYAYVVDEAIEYIDKHKENEYRNGRNDEIYLELNEKELKEFLKILKGESNE